MTIALRYRPRAVVLAFVLVLIAGALTIVAANPAEAQEPTGASATKDCPDAPFSDPYTLGDTVTCLFSFSNLGFFPATVTALTETSPVPGGTPENITCETAPGTAIGANSILGPNIPCSTSLTFTIPTDPAICNTIVVDRADIALSYDEPEPGLTAGAFAEHRLAVVCPPSITIAKTADQFSKVGDPVTYTITLCNDGPVAATRVSVIDTLLGTISDSFPATLAAGACAPDVVLDRTVLDSDPDPVVNTVTAIYQVVLPPPPPPLPPLPPLTDTATASATTALFQPAVDVTKECTPDPVEVGADETCTIVVTNTSSDDSPGLVNGTIDDTLTGDLLDEANPAIVDSDCAADLPVGGSCTITTTRTVLDTDPNPLENTVTVHYNPDGFPNDITDAATASVAVGTPPPPPPPPPPPRVTPPPPTETESLPLTGANTDKILPLAFVLLALGAVLVTSARRRRVSG
jgi:uncharacterized repeat protein (TIGR01451 family)